MEPTVLVLLAQGCEETESVTVIDILRRGGIEVTSAGLDHTPVIASRGVKLIPDTTLDVVESQPFDMVVLPGGLLGANNLAADERVIRLITEMATTDKFVCAICAAPKVLAKAGLLAGRRATSYPDTLSPFDIPGFTYTGEAITRDGNIVTSRGPGTAMDFALLLVEILKGTDIRQRVEKGLVR